MGTSETKPSHHLITFGNEFKSLDFQIWKRGVELLHGCLKACGPRRLPGKWRVAHHLRANQFVHDGVIASVHELIVEPAIESLIFSCVHIPVGPMPKLRVQPRPTGRTSARIKL